MTKDATSTLDSLFQQLIKEVKTHGSKITKGFKGVVRFDVGEESWTLELLDDTKRLTKGESDLEADVELKATDENLLKIIMGQITPQTAFMLGKLQLSGDIALALKLQPILEAARPRAKM